MIQYFRNRGRKGFTLVELLAVIVILAIILVIAVPQIMSVINDTTKASFESSAKMVASQVENQYTIAQTLGKTEEEFNRTSGNCMKEWAGLNESDYESCTYEITSDGTAKVTLVGKGKFKALSVCGGTRSDATASEGACSTAEACFTGDNIYVFKLKDSDTCVDFLYSKYQVNGINYEGICQGGPGIAYRINDDIAENLYTFDDVIESGAFTYEGDGYTITDYDVSCGTKVVIPNKINDMPVFGISEYAFKSNGLTDVKLPNSLKYIGGYAFYDNQITNVVIPSNVDEVDSYSFYQGNIDLSVTLQDDNTRVSFCAFGYLDNIIHHNLPDTYECVPIG